MINKIALLLTLLLSSPVQALHLKSDEAHIDIKTIKISHITGIIDQNSAAQFLAETYATAALPGARIIFIDSPGGYIDSGQLMLNVMESERKQGVKQVCVVTGSASSMAFNFLTHCDVRMATADSRFVVHKAEMDLPPGVRHTAANLRLLANELDKEDEQFRQANSKAMHLTLPQYDAATAAEMLWTADQLHLMHYLNSIVKGTH